MKFRFQFLAITALVAAIPGFVVAQPRPKEGTRMVPNEYGSEFPQEIIWERDGSEMVLIPHGTFRMGLSTKDGGMQSEGPVHEVYLPSFYIDKYEISNEQYSKYYSVEPTARPRPSNRELTAPELPVSGIPWYAAEGYAAWVGRELPTEAMWEKAARGPENTIHTTGNQRPDKDVVHHGRGAGALTVPVTKDTGDVSGYGVYHMGGNVSEWVRDWHKQSVYEGRTSVENPTGPEDGDTKVFRGGSFTSPGSDTRATRRTSHPPALLLDDVGFRTVWVPRPVQSPKTTPTPAVTVPPIASDAEVLARLIEEVTPYMREHKELPSSMMAGSAFRYTGEEGVFFGNMSPFDVTLTFVNPEDEYVYKHDFIVPSMSFQQVQLTKSKDLRIVAMSPNAPDPGPYVIGTLRAESKPMVIIPTEFFATVVDQTGKEIDPGNRTASQYYDVYRPQWNEFEVINRADLPIVVDVSAAAPGSSETERRSITELTLEPQEIVRLTLDPDYYQFLPNYIGARGEGGRVHQIRLDEKAARRLLIVTEDKESDDKVVVITQRKPYLKILEKDAVRR